MEENRKVLREPIALTMAETKQVAGGYATVIDDTGSGYKVVGPPPGGHPRMA
jgi:hypothetical protein